jgi:hypothetical protein
MTSEQPQSPANESLPHDSPATGGTADRYSIAVDGRDGVDGVLGRHIQVRSADAAGAEALEREARFFARLEHGSIPPLHDFVRGPDGAILVSRQVQGMTLADAIADARGGTVCPELSGAVPAMQVMLRVCDALAAAHAADIVHRQISPAVITLALHGEVLVSGWEAARSHQDHPLSGRYTTEAGPGALHAIDDLHVDIRSVGACLFEALVRRPPTPAVSDPFTDVGTAEGSLLSPRVCTLIRCAMRSSKSGGFRSMAELHRAIEHCIADEIAVTNPAGFGRYRRPNRWIARIALGAALVAGVGALWVLPHWRNPGDSWSDTVASEDFSNDSWKIRWSGSDAWTVQQGRLVSSAADSARLTLRQRLSVPVAIEYTAQIQAGKRPGDLSVVWSESGADGTGTGQRTVNGARTFSIQAGAYDNSYCGIFLQPGDQRLAHNTLQLEPGRDYRFRVEIENGRIAMLIDGVKVLEYRDRFPSTSGFVSLLGWYPGKSFDNVVVLGRPLDGTVPTSAMGDSLYSFGHYDDAATMYGRLTEGGDVDRPSVQDAIFRKGMAERRAGRLGDSSETWSRLTNPALVQATDSLRLEDLLRTGQYDLLIERMRSYWRRSGLAHADLQMQWAKAASEAANSKLHNDAFADALLQVRQDLFPQDTTTGYEAARVLLRLERYEDVLRDFPNERRSCVAALMALGRLDDLDKLSYLVPMDRQQMNFARGRYEDVLESESPASYHRAVAACKLGRAAELTGRWATHPAMLHLGQAETLLGLKPVIAPNECLVALGRFEQAAGDELPGLPGSGHDWHALAILGRTDEAEKSFGAPLPWLRLLQAVEAGDLVAAAAVRPDVRPSRNVNRPWFPTMVIGPFVDRMAGHPETLDAALRTMAEGWQQYQGQRAWRFARAALGQAEELDVVGMPAVTEGRAWWLVASALRAEREGRPADARQAYEGFLALPGHLRLLEDNTFNAPVEYFVRWRLRALAR